MDAVNANTATIAGGYAARIIATFNQRIGLSQPPRQPITFQVRETLVAMGIWFVLVFAFDTFALGLGIAANAGIAFFAAFMLATLTVTGRHMMFRITQDDE